MCGRASLTAAEILQAAQALLIAIRCDDVFETLFQKPRYNIAPTQNCAFIRHATGGPELVSMQWGYSTLGRPFLFNVRSETVRQKFRAPFSQRRGLMLATGFYEWAKVGKRRLPSHFTLPASPVFAMASIFEQPLTTGKMHAAFAVLTTEANDLVRPLHDRMPVILDPKCWEAWLDHGSDLNEVASLLKPYPPTQMQATRCSAKVNDVKNDGPECLGPPEPEEKTLFD